MIIYLESLGCCRNQVDSEVMLGRLTARGHTMTQDPAGADVIIVNTCGFISAASQEAVDTVLAMAAFKQQGKCSRLVVTGCLTERYKNDDLAASLPEVDAFLGTGAFDDIVEAVEGAQKTPLARFSDPASRSIHSEPLPRELTLPYSAYVKVAEGCNRKCTYCIIPALRGPQRSRPARDIILEAETLALKGVKEIILVGESTTDYGLDFPIQTDAAMLLEQLDSHLNSLTLQSLPWVRLLYTHPASLDNKIIRAVSKLDTVCTYFDVPVQHASTAVLKRMGRPYTRDQLRRLFNTIRSTSPDASLRTTLITGFPGETDSDFNALVSFIQEIRFDHLGVLTYSDSDDLKSHYLKNHVPETLAQERQDILMDLQAEISRKNNLRHLDRTYQVIVEENPDDGLYLGRTRFQAPEVDGMTFIYNPGLEIGAMIDVKITETHEYDLAGEPE